MKKILILSILCLFANGLTNAQLNIKTVEEAHNYRTVYACRQGFGFYVGEIRYISEGFVLFGVTDNQFEHSMASIFLGETKESALTTLYDLYEIIKGEKEVPKTFIVKGYNNKETLVTHSGGEFLIQTNGVAGYSHILWKMTNKFENALEALINFEIPEVE